MIRVAVVDDEKVITDKIENIVKNHFNNRHIEYEVKSYQLPNELLIDLEEKNYFDIYLLDIEMSVNGLDVAKSIRQLYLEPFIVFVTSYVQYSMKGYEYNAYRYIVKADLDDKLPEALDLMYQYLINNKRRYYIIETSSRIEKIDYEDLLYLQIEKKYTNFYTRKGNTKVRKSLGKVFSELNDKMFIYVDKSYVVNLHHVMELDNRQVTMRGGVKIQISNPQLRVVKKAISDYWRGKI